MYQNHLKGFLKHRLLGFAIRVSDLVVVGCISCNFQRDADANIDAAGLWTALCVSLFCMAWTFG